ncbi:jg5962 [Pararge aegeria aegeria]|uniref:Jg5962 protein n=1 Tax=Pararge aegeria aegeria TaxID=348720 RepID=A0A8S4REX3_9NEOP|nr:jg5962 [Pararge aegeria aegeria]
MKGCCEKSSHRIKSSCSGYFNIFNSNKQVPHGEPIIPEIMSEDPIYKLSLNEKSRSLEDESLADYYSDDEERQKALQAQKEKKQQIALKKES